MKTKTLQGLALTLLALVTAAPAWCQEAESSEGGALEEIVVTANRRLQSAQDVGISVTAYSGEQMRQMGFTKATDVVQMTPGLNYTVPNAESSQINFFLRGVGLNDFADASENPVAVYVDDVYHPASGGLSFQLFDMDRVEVLRGPQGTLFGRNTTGGLIHYVSKKPRKRGRRLSRCDRRRIRPVQVRRARSAGRFPKRYPAAFPSRPTITTGTPRTASPTHRTTTLPIPRHFAANCASCRPIRPTSS